ncbi:MAG: aminopeptidase P family protein [Clostridia bacterium]|nr:aminopeptidase P family protein [Clostridia bacterium]
MKNRIERLRKKLIEAKTDAAYIASSVSHRYLTGLDNPDGILVITQNNAYALEDFRYIEVARAKLSSIYTVIEMKGNALYDTLNEILKSENVSTLGFEDTKMSVKDFDTLKSKLNAEFIGLGNVTDQLREIKTPEEVAEITNAQRITDLAFEHILKMLTPSMTENDVACELEYFMRKNGAEDKSFETIAVSGVKSSMPHGVPANIKLSCGFLTMDFGAVVNGYHSDMTRTVCIGKADTEMKKLYNTVLSAQLSALEFISAGKECDSVDKIARDIINKDYNGTFGHSLGHGVGLEIHESPRLSPLSRHILTAGNVVTVEPGIYIAGKYGCRIEDMVLITENSALNFTKSPKELIEIY